MSKIHIVKQGDTLSKLAKKYGFNNWRKIYDHSDNAELRQKRTNPNILYPGDKVFIPDKTLMDESDETEKRHTFRIKKDKLWLRIFLKGFCDDQQFSGKPYRLRVKNQIFEGTTDSDGMLEHEIPSGTNTGMLIIEDKEYSLKIGHLDPIDTVTGWQARLNNLGYNAGKVNGKSNNQTFSAIEEFQCDHDLKVDGIAGSNTQTKLEEVHGC
ncbi:MAG: LysM peptidoglycan-binding domain-containing protein [Desulfobacteraceae bacterium]|nr:LysM peptidoglycan-binding domain-containing protein [Desulfobacteraceae bacterium]MBC2719684.1 peptidoglycan-binding protein [Desulfobacteraceae bacterium]